MTKIHTANGSTYVHDNKTGDTYTYSKDIFGHVTSSRIGHGCTVSGSSVLAERDSNSRVTGYTNKK